MSYIKTKVKNNRSIQYLLIFTFFLAVYTISCAPTVLWQDSGLFVHRIWNADIKGTLGLALSHPLYIMIGLPLKYIPVAEFAARVNFISSFFGALAVANLFTLARMLTLKHWPAIIATLTLGFSWTFWWHSSVAEAYTLYAFQLTIELILLYKFIQTGKNKWLLLLAFANGLSIANHLWGILPLACYGLFWLYLLYKRRIGFKIFASLLFLWILGCLPYEYLVISEYLHTGDMAGTISSALFGAQWESSVMNAHLTLKIILENFIFIALNFPSPSILLIPLGLFLLLKRKPRQFSLIFLAMLVLFFIFAFRYKVPDRHAFFFPVYIFLSLAVSFAVEWLMEKWDKRFLLPALTIFAIIPIFVYVFLPEIGRKFYPSLAQRRQRPYRDEYVYFLQPWKTGYTGAKRFAIESLNEVEQNAALYSEYTSVHAVLYAQQVLSIRQDVNVFTSRYIDENVYQPDKQTVDELVKRSEFYTVTVHPDYVPDYFLNEYDARKAGIIYKLLEKNKEEN